MSSKLHAGFIALHLGAGKHSSKNEGSYRKLCLSTCQKAASLLLDGKSALEVACQTVALLEDSPLTNAGFGSMLNEEGDVECDAGIMVSENAKENIAQFGAVSALKCIQNPILVAKEVIMYQKEPGILGRVPPCLLVGDGALRFARQRGLATIDNDKLISSNARKRYNKYKKKLEELKSSQPGVFEIHIQPQNQDTVGAICIDCNGNIASASSSGGIALKLPGRTGQVSMFGCGCWAQHDKGCGVGVATSGCGEHLITTLLAQRVGESVLMHGDPATHLKSQMDRFIGSSDVDGIVKMGGVILAYYDGSSVDFNVAFSTESMVIGLMTTQQQKAKVRISRRNSSSANCLTMEGFIIKL